MKKVKITFEIVDQNDTQLVDLGTQEVSYDESDIDLEYELVHNSGGSPVVRPKQAPKY